MLYICHSVYVIDLDRIQVDTITAHRMFHTVMNQVQMNVRL